MDTRRLQFLCYCLLIFSYLHKLSYLFFSIMLDNSFSFADWHKRHSLYMWRCFCWFGENNLGKVILVPLAFGIWFVMVGILLLLCLKTFEQCFQASRFFYWVWCSSSCKHENWWCYKCFCNLNTVRDCKCLSATFLL